MLFKLPGPIPTTVFEFGGISVLPASIINAQGKLASLAFLCISTKAYSDLTFKTIFGYPN